MKMRRFALAFAAVAVVAAPVTAQNHPPTQEDRQGVVGAAMDYMEGAVTADAERVARGVHPELNKIVINTLDNGRQILGYNRGTTLVEIVRGLGDRMASVDKNVDVTVFDIGADVASVRAVGQLWYDLLQIAKVDGQWRLMNVLWAQNRSESEGPDPTGTEADRADVERVALDYIEGMYSGDVERVEGALHPELNRVELRTHRETGRSFMSKMGYSTPVEIARGGLVNLDEDQRNIEVEIFDVSHGIASVKVTSARFIEHLQIASVNGEWKIINLLWVRNQADT